MDNERWKNTTLFHEKYSIYKGLNVLYKLTHYGLVMLYGVGNFGQHQFNSDLVSIGTLGTNFSEIGIKIQNFSFMKMHLKMSSAKWQTFCPGRDVFKDRSCISLAIVHNLCAVAWWNELPSQNCMKLTLIWIHVTYFSFNLMIYLISL